MKSVNAKFARVLLIRLGFLVVTIELIFSECNFTHSYIGQLTYSCLFSAKILYILYILCLNVGSEDIPAEFFYDIGVYSKIEFLRNLFNGIQEQVQNLAKFIYMIKHTSTSPHYTVLLSFLCFR